MRRNLFIAIVAALLTAISSVGASNLRNESLDAMRKKAEKASADGNYSEAYSLYEKLCLDPKDDPLRVGQDLAQAISLLNRLNRANEADALREKIINIHNANWRLLHAAGQSYFNENHYGYIVAGEFQRGSHRGGGRQVSSWRRDRVRALQLMTQALAAIGGEDNSGETASFHLNFADMILGGGYNGGESWRLQYLTDLSQLPDYEEGYYGYGYSGQTQGAPADADGNPVFHKLPRNYEASSSDGQRWRWLLWRAMDLNSSLRAQIMRQFAGFLEQQFGVATMSSYGAYFGRATQDEDARAGTYSLHTLGEDETIARLATGVKRFKLPDEFNFIKIYKEVADDFKNSYGEQSLGRLASIFENRRQYDKAADYWKRSIKQYGDRHDAKQNKIDQILGNWGQFEPIMTHPAGEEASLEFLFRNGKKVSFEGREIRIKELLNDVKEYLKNNPRSLEYETMNISDLGYRIVQEDEDKYVGGRVAQWELTLDPAPNRFDKRITIKTPLKKAGAYLLTAKMKGGNESKIIIWIDDTVLARRQLDDKAWFFVADAVTGRPLPGVNVEFFGYKQERTDWQKLIGRRFNVSTSNFAEITDHNGQAAPAKDDFETNYNWLISATTEEGRLAYLGFTSVWYGNYYDREYNETKVFTITDRPVYRPNQSVKFKFWARHAKYDQEDKSSFANSTFTARITDPKGDKVFEKSFRADEYGGFDGEYPLPDDAALGVYSIHIPGYGGGSFRVEEYKKPEFEVKIEAPSEPVTLGEKIKASIEAKYYFGAPVVKAKVKYKILRSDHDADWRPPMYWDWFYGPGYWWFAYDYEWYPGWREWGCVRPWPWWIPFNRTPPEVVAEAEVEIGADGKVQVEIDTGIAKELHGDKDHKYEITAEVVDESRRTIVGKGSALVARKPFKVYAWVDRGHYRVGDVVKASFSAQTPDGKPIQGKGRLDLFRISHENGELMEKSVQKWDLDTNPEGRAEQQLKASKPGQYRLSYKLTDSKEHMIEGGYVFVVRGEGVDGKDFRFNEIELVQDKAEYAPGETVRLMINTDRAGGTVVLFVRPANGIYLQPKVIRLEGKSAVEEIIITKKDMPNFFVEAFTVSNGKLYSDVKEIIVPPEKRVVNVEVEPSSEKYKPGEKATVDLKLTTLNGEPFIGSTTVTVYDKAVEYISGGSNVPEIKAFFWKWRRRHQKSGDSSLDRWFSNLVPKGEIGMGGLGAFGHLVADDVQNGRLGAGIKGDRLKKSRGAESRMDSDMVMESEGAMAPAPMMKMAAAEAPMKMKEELSGQDIGSAVDQPESVEPTVRKEFADTAFWAATVNTDRTGLARIEFDMPENLTGWKIKTWGMGHGTVVGEGEAEIVTTKNLLLRLQAPRFFVEKDEVVLSANIHNYLENAKSVRAVLELEGGCLEFLGEASQTIEIKANGEERVDWRVKVVREGEAVIRMKALTDEESDAMEMRFPVYVHGMLKTDSFSGVIRPEGDSASMTIDVPTERRIEQSVLEIRYSPTLAGAMVDALPYLAEYPYGCTEQTLNRFLPTVVVQKILLDMGLDLKAIQEKQTNLNAQEIGDDVERAGQWKRWPRNPVFDQDVVVDMVKKGLKRLTAMQLGDGGWGWFSGWGERSYPHTTATVVHGLQIAKENNVGIVPGVLESGVEWLKDYQAKELRELKNAESKTEPWKSSADNLDALVFMVLVDAGLEDADMRELLYRDRNNLAVYAKAMYGMALYKRDQAEKLAMIMQNIEQYLVEDNENQTAYLNLPNASYWWHWYGSEYEAHAYYLKLLALTEPKSQKAAGLVKYLLNNRKHATHWNSTRDTALCIEALANYLRASGEDKPDMTVEIFVDGQKKKEERITAQNLFMFDNKLLLEGRAVESGEHKVEIRRKGKGPVYFNAYLTNFTLEDFIAKAGLEIKVDREYYKLKKVDKTIKVAGSRGQALDQKAEKFEREKIKNLDLLKSGDLVEIELIIQSKNDYEYLVFEDMKPAGFEAVEVQSGYTGNEMGAYVEFRDERVVFFAGALARGKHSVSYRMRAEIPGKFSALPTRAHAMYAPELRANSDELKISVED